MFLSTYRFMAGLCLAFFDIISVGYNFARKGKKKLCGLL
jgi:hypothetical protein